MTLYLTGDSRRGFTGRKFYTGPLWVEEREGRSHHRALVGKTWPRQFTFLRNREEGPMTGFLILNGSEY